MIRMTGSGIVVLVMASMAAPQDTTDKHELRYAFTKGEKLTLTLTQKMNVKLDEVPEQFQGIAPEEPFDVTFEGEATFEVTGVDGSGTATLEGKFQKITSKGSIMGQEYYYSYDRAKDGEPKETTEGDSGPGIPGMVNPEEMLPQLAKATLKVEIGALGKFKVSGGAKGMGDQLLDLGGLTGPLPKDKVGPGDKWKNSDALTLPGLPVKMLVRSDNSFDKIETVGGQECAAILSKFNVGTENGNDAEGSDDSPVPIKATFEGEGTGSMRFSLTQGRPLKNETKMEAKFKVTFGEGVDLKGKFTMEQNLGLKRRE